jgi:hypothetical protein
MRAFILTMFVGCGFTAELPPNEPAPDATAAPVFELSQCPANYVPIGGGRYRIGPATTYRAAHDDCKDDSAGFTHLVVLDSRAEGDLLRQAANGAEYFTGGVQQPGLGSAKTGWFAITGAALIDTWASDEPNDAADEKNVARFTSDGMHDESKDDSMRTICECDGHAIDPVIEGYL